MVKTVYSIFLCINEFRNLFLCIYDKNKNIRTLMLFLTDSKIMNYINKIRFDDLFYFQICFQYIRYLNWNQNLYKLIFFI